MKESQETLTAIRCLFTEYYFPWKRCWWQVHAYGSCVGSGPVLLEPDRASSTYFRVLCHTLRHLLQFSPVMVLGTPAFPYRLSFILPVSWTFFTIAEIVFFSSGNVQKIFFGTPFEQILAIYSPNTCAQCSIS